jgi:hypothetical protein
MGSFRVWIDSEVGAYYSKAKEAERVGEASSLADDSYRLVPGQQVKGYGDEGWCHRPQILSIRSTASYHG